jgi:hypothetical protein
MDGAVRTRPLTSKARWRFFQTSNLYAPPQDVVLTRRRRTGVEWQNAAR